MKRMFLAAAPFITAAMMVAGPALAATKVSCKGIDAQLAKGLSPAAVAKQLKVSQATVKHCQTAMNAANSGQSTSKTR